MRITTKIVFDIESLEVLSHECYEYSGPLELCGGGKSAMRKLTEQQAQDQAARSKEDRQTELDATGKVKNIAAQLTSTGPGKLSPWSSANYASNLDNITNTYAKQRQMGFRALNQSGFGTSPGAVASIFNTSGEQAGKAQTDAWRSALQDTLNQNLEGANLEQGVSSQYGAQTDQESSQAVADAAQRMKMGSTFGDVMGGIGAIAPYVAAPFTGGASLGFAGMKMPGSGGGSAAPSGGFGGINPNYQLPGLTKPMGGYSRSGVGSY